MKKNVLVFPCGSEIGLEVYKSLQYSTHFEIFGASSVDDHGKFVYKNYIGNVPDVNHAYFIPKINAVVDQYEIDFIIPAHDSVSLKLSQEKAANNLNPRCQLITSSAETNEIARSKVRTYAFFEGTIAVPKIYEQKDQIQDTDLPVFLKPDVGQGSKGTYLAKTREAIDFYITQNPALMLLEYLPGAEYTIDCFTNKNGQLLFCAGRERMRVSNGISVHSEVVPDERFQVLAQTINSKLTFRGVWFFQIKKRADGELVLLEVAPRVAGTMGLTRARGVNLPLLSLFDAMGFDVEVLANSYKVIIDRALENRYLQDINYKHVYLDFDDLVIFNNKVNLKVMTFIFQCLNDGIEIHLLTKHKKDLHSTLNEFKLDKIFGDIIWISDTDEKYKYIKYTDSIFIDDSHAERAKVAKRLGIPTFDAHMLEALIREG